MASILTAGLVSCGGNVEITFPAFYYADEEGNVSEQAVTEEVAANGYEGYTADENGVTFTMTSKKHSEQVKALKAAFEQNATGMIKGENAITCFDKILYNDNLSEISVYVDPDVFTSEHLTVGYDLCALGAYYQMFCGADKDAVEAFVYFYNKYTDEIITTLAYSLYAEQLEALTKGEKLEYPKPIYLTQDQMQSDAEEEHDHDHEEAAE